MLLAVGGYHIWPMGMATFASHAAMARSPWLMISWPQTHHCSSLFAVNFQDCESMVAKPADDPPNFPMA